MDITPADTDDIDTLVERWVELARGQRDHGTHLLPAENRAAIRQSIARSVAGERVLVAREDGIVGLVTFDIEQVRYEQDVDRGIVENLYVDPDRRGSGLGAELLAAAEKRLREAGVDVISLEAMADNVAARRFYRAQGYEPHRVELEKSLGDDA